MSSKTSSFSCSKIQHYFFIPLFVRFTCHSQFDLYLLLFSSAGSNFNSSKISSFLLWSRRVLPNVLKNLISCDVSIFHPLLRVQILLPFKIMGRASVLYTSILKNFWIWTQCAFFLSCLQTWKPVMHYSVFLSL